MAQHISCEPMTAEQRREFAEGCRIQAAQQLAANPPNTKTAEILLWIASNYEREPGR